MSHKHIDSAFRYRVTNTQVQVLRFNLQIVCVSVFGMHCIPFTPDCFPIVQSGTAHISLIVFVHNSCFSFSLFFNYLIFKLLNFDRDSFGVHDVILSIFIVLTISSITIVAFFHVVKLLFGILPFFVVVAVVIVSSSMWYRLFFIYFHIELYVFVYHFILKLISDLIELFIFISPIMLQCMFTSVLYLHRKKNIFFFFSLLLFFVFLAILSEIFMKNHSLFSTVWSRDNS